MRIYYIQLFCIILLFSNSCKKDKPNEIFISGSTVSIHKATPGFLGLSLSKEELKAATKLIIDGSIDARDFRIMRDMMPNLAELDIANVKVEEYIGTEGTLKGLFIDPYQYLKDYIPPFAFYTSTSKDGNNTLSSVILPNSITKIDVGAFAYCFAMKNINLPTSLTDIDQEAFFCCYNLRLIQISSKLAYIGANSLLGCGGTIIVDSNNLTYSASQAMLFNKLKTRLIHCSSSATGDIVVPSSITTISANAFYGCGTLHTIKLLSAVKEIEKNAFLYCNGNIIVDSTNTYFSSKDGILFNKNQSLLIYYPTQGNESYTIPEGVKEIGICAFMACEKLTTVSFPKSLISIDSSAFKDCINLQSIYFKNKYTVSIDLNDSAFANVDRNKCILYVPVGSKRNYQINVFWQNFKNIVEQ